MKHKTKRNLAGSLMIIIFLMGFIIPAYIQADYLNFDQLTETQPVNILDQGFESDPETINNADPETKQSVIDSPNQWFLSESVLTKIEFNSQLYDYATILTDVYPKGSSHTFSQSNPFDAYLEDDSFSDWVWDFTSALSTIHGYAFFRVYCAGSGSLAYDIVGRVTDTASNSLDTSSATSSFSVSSSYLDSQGYLNLEFWLLGAKTTVDLYLKCVLPTGNRIEIFHVSNTGSLPNDVDYLRIRIDQLAFTRNTITNTVRSEQKYASSAIMINKKIIPSVPHAKEITVNLMEDETVTSVNPSASWSVSSNVLTISSPVELNYEILTSRTCSNHLAIAEVSTDFLTDVGFETGQYLTDWTVAFGNVSMNTQTSFEGYYSLSIETSNNDYFTSIYGDACDFEEDVDEFDIKLNGLPTLDTILHDSEYKLRLYTGSAGSNYGARRNNLAIDTNQFNNFATKILMSSTQSDRVKIILHFDDASSQEHIELIASPTTVEFNFAVFADKTIDKIDIFYGDSSWNIAGGDRIYVAYIKIVETGAELSLTLPENDYYLSYSTYIESGNVTLTTNDQTIVNNGSITDRWINNFVFTHTDTVTFAILFDDLDLTNFLDNFGIFQTSTTIETLEPSKYQISSTLRSWDGYKNPLLEGQQILNTTLLERSSQTVEYSTNLTSITGLFELEYGQALEQKEYELWTYSHSSGEFNNCSFYFTPSYAYETDYAETELNDAWDWSEGDTENIQKYGYTTDYVLNGIYAYDFSYHTGSGSVTAFGFYLGSNTLILQDYNTMKIKIKTNQSGYDFKIYGVKYHEETGKDYGSCAYFEYLVNKAVFDTTWSIFTFTLTDIIEIGSLWFVITSSVYPSQDTQDGDFIFINFIEFVHEDDPVLYDSYYWFQLTSTENTYRYSCYSDENYLGVYSDLEPIAANNSIGTHNFTYVLFTDNTEKAFIPVIYELIYYNPESDNYYLDLGYNYDLVGTINVLVFTFWGNQTLDIWDNSTKLLDDQPEGDITTFYEVTEGFHNITVEVYNSAELWDTLNFGFYIVLPEAIENYYLVFDSPSIDAAAGLVYLTYSTYWGNCTYRLKDNSSWCGTAINEGSSVWEFYPTYGFHNFSVYVYQGGDTWDIIVFSLTLSAPETEYNYYRDLWNPGIDLLAGLIYFEYSTYFGNTTVRLALNDSWLGSAVGEGFSSWSFIPDYGFLNFSIYIYQGGDTWDYLEIGITNVEPAQAIYTVHLDLFDQGGLGVTFSEVKCYINSINDTNRLSQDFLTLDQNFTLYVTDYFNVTLTYFDVTLNYTLSTNYVDVEILLYEAEFKNRYNFAVTLEIVRNYHSHSFTLIANQTISFWITAGTYNITSTPLVNAEYDSYSEAWTTTSQIKHYRIYLDPKPVTVKKPINVVAFVIFIVQAGAIAGGLTFAYMNIYKPLRKEFFGFSLKNAFKHKKKQTWTTIVIAIVAIAMGGLYTLGV